MHEDAARSDAGLLAGAEFILGGQKSGKSRRAEALAQQWLAASGKNRALLIATARAGDAEMAARIARHRRDRTRNCPALQCVEEPLLVPAAIKHHSAADTLVLVDCLTLWLTNLLAPATPTPTQSPGATPQTVQDAVAALQQAINAAPGPLLLVGNEIGQGVIPMGSEVRAFVDALGQLNQAVAQSCARVTLMVAGLPLRVKGAP